MTKMRVRRNSVLALGIASLMALSFGVTGLTPEKAGADMLSEPEFGNYFVSDYDSIEDAFEAGIALNQEIYAEGVTLLKNEDKALPLEEGAKITLLGKNSNTLSEFGGGAAHMQGIETPILLVDALENEGFKVNPDFVKFYADNTRSGDGRGSQENGKNFPGNGNIVSGYNTGETPISSYTKELTDTTNDYNDAAIVVFKRTGGEGTDLPRTMTWDGSNYRNWSTKEVVPGARSADDHYLQLDKNETDLLKYANDHFSKVVVLLNMGTTLECGFLDDPGHYAYQPNIKAALNIGYPGKTGTPSLAKILKGEINPSGKTVDTWARDFKTDTTWENFGNYRVQNGNRYKDTNINYVTYNEGIYVGYRYWETRGYDEGLDKAYASGDELHGTSTKNWKNWYGAHVVYPLGYGLSYTTFNQELVETTPAAGAKLTADGTITAKVKVTNTGSVAGKDVVQLYYTPEYHEGGIEKAQVLLCAFGKTSLLKPNESETLTLSFKVRDMASYDWSDANKNNFKGYELEAGNYTVRLMKNAHEQIASTTYEVETGFRYTTSETTGNEIENRFDEVSNYINDQADGYLSRSDWEGTFPKSHVNLTAPQWVIDEVNEWSGSGDSVKRPESEADEPWYVPEDKMPTQGADNNLTLFDMVGKEYDDPIWETFLNRLTVEQLTRISMEGGYYSGIDYPDLGITRVHNNDDPNGIHEGEALNNWAGWYISFVNEAIISSTWNKDLSFAKGENIGNQALWGVGRGNIPGWYAPATDTHRSQFGGRNFEYYSEDGFLAGMMAASQVRGAQSKGMFCYVKHFALNDQETNRTGLCTWANEQSMREIYFKSFEICVKYGGALATMSALNRIGATWAGGDYRLLTRILRDEWGFCGSVVTDSYMDFMGGADLMIRAGGNLALGTGKLTYNVGSATVVTALRNAVHGILYAHANSMAMNRGAKPIPPNYIAKFQGGSLETGIVGQEYSASIATASIDKENYPDFSDSDIKYALAEGSSLPAGLTLSEDGTISGTPEEATNNFPFKATATYTTSSKSFTMTSKFTISIVGAGGSIVYETDPDLAPATVGKPYTASVAGAKVYTAGGTDDTPITYSLKAANFLPGGLTLSADGTISGTPLIECENYRFTVVANAEGFDGAELTFTISVYKSLDFEGGKLEDGKYGAPYSHKFVTEEGVSYRLKEGSSLPNGLALSENGVLSGTPKETVTDRSFTVIASAPLTETKEATFTISIGIAFNKTALPKGTQNSEYSANVDTAQGAGEIVYSLKSGALPKGLTLSGSGVISGTPTESGTFVFTVAASAEGKLGDEIELTLEIEATQGGQSGTDGQTPAEEKSGCFSTVGAEGIPLIGVLIAAAFVLSRGKNKKKR